MSAGAATRERRLDIVDHDAIASGQPSNLGALQAIVRADDVRIPIQVCGGIRTYEHARTLLQVRVQHADEADDLFTKLMGEVVEPRREFIQDNALYAALDV